MALQAKPLTNTEVKAARATNKDLSLHDGGGLLLFVKTSGVKTWRFRYYHPVSKKRTTVTFGNYPALSLAEARQKREAAKALLVKKIDPQEYQRTALASEQEARINTLEKRLRLISLKSSNPVSRKTMHVTYGDHLNVIFFLPLDISGYRRLKHARLLLLWSQSRPKVFWKP